MNQSTRFYIEYVAFRLARFLFSVLPEVIAIALGSLLGFVAGSVFRIRRPEVDRHLEWAFPERSRSWRARVARGSYRHLGRELVSLFRAERWGKELVIDRTHMVGFDDVLAATKVGGVLILTGHLGSWEIGAASVPARGLNLDVVAKQMANRRFGAVVTGARERLGMRIIDMEGAAGGVLQALQAGTPVMIAADQNAHRGGVFVPFFGKLAATPRGPALFALRSGVPVFLMFAIRDPGWKQRYTVTFTRLMYTQSTDRKQDLMRLTRQYLEALEEAIRQAPAQYFWQHKRWKKRPPEEQR